MIRASDDDSAPDLGEAAREGFVRCDKFVENNDGANQVLGTPDSLLVPSEPPDIKNWFSSYVYESFVLETNDNFEFSDNHESEAEKEESSTQSRKKAIEDSTGIVGSAENDDIVSEKIATGSFINCNRSGEEKENEHQGIHHVLDSPGSPLLSIEPPDIRNWFSSYVYESPTLNTNDDFQFSDHNKSTVNGRECSTEQVSQAEEDTSGFIRTDKKDDVGEKKASGNFVKYEESLGNHECEPQTVTQVNNSVGKRGAFSVSDEIALQKIRNDLLQGERIKDHDDGSTEDNNNSTANYKNPTTKLKSEFPREAVRRSMDINVGSLKNVQVSPRKLILRRDSIKACSEKKGQAEDELDAKGDLWKRARSNNNVSSVSNGHVSPRKLIHGRDSIKACSERKGQAEDEQDGNGDLWKRTRSNTLKKDRNDCGVNGFVSTKRSVCRRESDENSMRSCSGGNRSPQLKNQEKVSSVGHMKDETARRKVLTDLTNIQQSSGLEITGKWKCPRKSKPNLGPPLKQLRLERWVHRV